jgi:hypothetical protein
MWLITQHGAYSVVAYDPHRDPVAAERRSAGTNLLVRARARRDLEALRRWLPDLEVREDPAADYRFRTVVSPPEWDRVLISEARLIDYPNFKSRVAETLGSEREALYTRVWTILRSLQEEL